MRIAVIVLLAVSWPGLLLAEAGPAIRAGAEANFPPYADVDERGRAIGFSVELLDAVARAMGMSIEYRPGPWNTVWTDLQHGDIDVLPLVARLPEREGLVEFTRRHTLGYDSFFVRRGETPIASLDGARSRSIIVLRSDAAHHALLARGFDRQLVVVGDLADGFRMLAAGHYDALLAPLVQGDYQLKRLGLAGVVRPGPLLKEYRREFCFAVKKGDTRLRDRLDEGLAIVKVTGEYDRLYRKWLGIHEPVTFPVTEVAWAAGLAAVLLASLGLWTWLLRRQVAARTGELAEVNQLLEQRVAERGRALSASEERYRILFSSMTEGFALHEIITDAAGRPVDYRFVDANPAFEELTGLKRAELVGRRVLDVMPQLEPFWIETYGRVALTGEAAHFERYSQALDRWYEVYAYQPEPGHFAVIFSDITERKRAEAALREADRRKDEFLAVLAHELRNPLTPISLAAHLLKQPGLDAAQQRWASDTIADRVAHISRLVDDLLDVSRISHGRIELKRQVVDLGQLVERAVAPVWPQFKLRRQRFELDLPERPVYLDADPVRLTQVLVNLLDNAAKYTPEGGHIELAARVDGGELEMVVRDDGVGIAADLLPHVFDLFRQDERTLDRSQGGLGIGLCLAQRLVELHGGRIGAASPGPGQGSMFTIRLPLPALVPLGQAKAPEADPAGRGMPVLVVDDDRLVAYGLGKMLTLQGYEVRTAENGDEALALAAEWRPRAILLDIGLVGMDGCETARRLRQLPGGEGFRLIALSGYSDEATLARGRAAGFDAHLVKPIDYRRLAEELARA